MRQEVTSERLRMFMESLGRDATASARIFLVGGATAVLLGWRATTIDIDVKLIPDSDQLLRTLASLKEALQINIELASPGDFIPELPGWEERSRFICQQGKITFLHYDFYAQALAKIERGHETDLSDVQHFIRHKLVAPEKLRELFSQIEQQLYRYPAIDAASFKTAVDSIVLRDE